MLVYPLPLTHKLRRTVRSAPGATSPERGARPAGELGAEHRDAGGGKTLRRPGDQNVHHAGLRRDDRGSPGHVEAPASQWCDL